MKESNQIWSNLKKSLILAAALAIFGFIIYDWYSLWEEQRVTIKEHTEK